MSLGFFHQSTPPRALTHGLNPFSIWLHIQQDNHFENRQNRIPQASNFFYQRSLLIFTFSSNYIYDMFTYLFSLVSL
jgi:hypothetical protein